VEDKSADEAEAAVRYDACCPEAMRLPLTWPGVVLGAAFLAACVTGDDPSTSDADVTTECEVVSAKDGHTLSAGELASLGDPIAKLVLSGSGCPKTFAEVEEKLAVTDPCRTEAPADPGIGTRFVSERSTLLETPDEYRTVTSRQCLGRRVHELLLRGAARAGAGGSIDTATVGSFVELIGEKRDATKPERVSGVFNFYARDGGRWTFFGGSDDFVSQGYDCNDDGACIPRAAAKQRCAGCHVGGGLVMKELENPWTFWRGSRSVPIAGTPELAAKFPQIFGTRLNGTEMELSVVRPGNAEWANTRLEVLEGLGLKEVLRPLFCTLDMNLEMSTSMGTEVGVPLPRVLNEHVFLDPIWPNTPRLAGTDPHFANAEKAIGQRMIDSATNKPFERDGEIVLLSALPVPGALSLDHRRLLVETEIVDEDFVKDVLSVDMTRPTYSPTRCKLLEKVPALPVAEMRPARIKKAVAEALGSATGAAAELRTSLLDENDAAAHDGAARTFLEACMARQANDPAKFAADVVRYTSHLRHAVRRAGGIIETPEMLATDDLPDAPRGFDRVTCTLTE
jgi:hypothetical protein